MKENEIRIYLKKDIKIKLDYLARLMEIPTSRLLRLMIEEDNFMKQLDVSIQLIEKAKSIREEGASQLSIYDIK